MKLKSDEQGELRVDIKGQYIVLFKSPKASNSVDPPLYSFIGECDNFTPTGVCAFSNRNNQMLLVSYKETVQMRLCD
ncbi:hypothetical protein D1872_280200 [compost metagenome]